jgi:hypothetical protein
LKWTDLTRSVRKKTKRTHKNKQSDEHSNRRNNLQPKDIVERKQASAHPLTYCQTRTINAESSSVPESRTHHHQADHHVNEYYHHHLRRNDPADHKHWAGDDQEGFIEDGILQKKLPSGLINPTKTAIDNKDMMMMKNRATSSKNNTKTTTMTMTMTTMTTTGRLNQANGHTIAAAPAIVVSHHHFRFPTATTRPQQQQQGPDHHHHVVALEVIVELNNTRPTDHFGSVIGLMEPVQGTAKTQETAEAQSRPRRLYRARGKPRRRHGLRTMWRGK